MEVRGTSEKKVLIKSWVDDSAIQKKPPQGLEVSLDAMDKPASLRNASTFENISSFVMVAGNEIVFVMLSNGIE